MPALLLFKLTIKRLITKLKAMQLVHQDNASIKKSCTSITEEGKKKWRQCIDFIDSMYWSSGVKQLRKVSGSFLRLLFHSNFNVPWFPSLHIMTKKVTEDCHTSDKTHPILVVANHNSSRQIKYHAVYTTIIQTW